MCLELKIYQFVSECKFVKFKTQNEFKKETTFSSCRILPFQEQLCQKLRRKLGFHRLFFPRIVLSSRRSSAPEDKFFEERAGVGKTCQRLTIFQQTTLHDLYWYSIELDSSITVLLIQKKEKRGRAQRDFDLILTHRQFRGYLRFPAKKTLCQWICFQICAELCYGWWVQPVQIMLIETE